MLRGGLSGLDWPDWMPLTAARVARASGPVERRLSDWRERTLGSDLPESVLSKKPRKPAARNEMVEGLLEWCGRWAMVDDGDGDGAEVKAEVEVVVVGV